jgi:hypothetical protein
MNGSRWSARVTEPVAGPSFAGLGLHLRAELHRLLAPAARDWLAAPPLDMPGRPPRLPGHTPEATLPWNGRGPREWRIYSRRSHDPAAPFLLRAVLPDAKPYDRLVNGAYQALLNQRPDPAGRAAYSQALESGALGAEVLLRGIMGSAEGMAGEEQIRLLCAATP